MQIEEWRNFGMVRLVLLIAAFAYAAAQYRQRFYGEPPASGYAFWLLGLFVI